MDGEPKRDEGTIVGGEALILQPRNGEEFERAIAQHQRVIVEALKSGGKMILYSVKNLSESQKDRSMRIITDTWRHLEPEEKAKQILIPFLEAGNQAHIELTEGFKRETSLESKPMSEAKN